MDARINPIASTDVDRYPTLTEDGRQILNLLREHPCAPRFHNESGNRLLAPEVELVRAHERSVLTSELTFASNEQPLWRDSFVEACLRDVPYFRRRAAALSEVLAFSRLPTIDRGDLGRDIADFVPDSVATERMINFRTSGTTGHPLLIASLPIVAASYLGFHRRALHRFGIELQHRRGQVGVILLGYQKTCFTYVSVTPTQDEAGLAKINLHPDDWKDPSDRINYLAAMNPEILAGDPLSFSVLLELSPSCRPRALFSTSMTLLPGLRHRLEKHFGCPVLDLYSMNEAGPIAVFDPAVGGHVLLQPRMQVEILDSAGNALPAGERGEITLTGGFNVCLPLLRYRTGDFARLVNIRGEPVLLDLEGRPPVRFRTTSGEWINNIEVTHALRPFPLSRFSLHQDSKDALHFRYDGSGLDEASLRELLLRRFGQDQSITIHPLPLAPLKHIQYTSDLEGACP